MGEKSNTVLIGIVTLHQSRTNMPSYLYMYTGGIGQGEAKRDAWAPQEVTPVVLCSLLVGGYSAQPQRLPRWAYMLFI